VDVLLKAVAVAVAFVSVAKWIYYLIEALLRSSECKLSFFSTSFFSTSIIS
jgi:hypothetical protein